MSRLSVKEYLGLALIPKEWGRMFFQTLGFILGRENIRRFLIQKLDNIAKKYNYNTSTYIAKEWIFPLTKKKFEDTEVYIPGNYDSYLRQMYGDYMQLPPEEKRISHHKHAFVDLYKRVNL